MPERRPSGLLLPVRRSALAPYPAIPLELAHPESFQSRTEPSAPSGDQAVGRWRMRARRTPAPHVPTKSEQTAFRLGVPDLNRPLRGVPGHSFRLPVLQDQWKDPRPHQSTTLPSRLKRDRARTGLSEARSPPLQARFSASHSEPPPARVGRGDERARQLHRDGRPVWPRCAIDRRGPPSADPRAPTESAPAIAKVFAIGRKARVRRPRSSPAARVGGFRPRSGNHCCPSTS